jgi:hypothetical protein
MSKELVSSNKLGQQLIDVDTRIKTKEDDLRVEYYQLGKLMYEASIHPDCPTRANGGLKKYIQTIAPNIAYNKGFKCKVIYEEEYLYNNEISYKKFQFAIEVEYAIITSPEPVKQEAQKIIDQTGTITQVQIDKLKQEHKEVLKKTTKLYEEKLKERPVIKDTIEVDKLKKERVELYNRLAERGDELIELRKEKKQALDELGKLKVKSKPEVVKSNTKQAQFDAIKLTNQISAAEFKLKEVEDKLNSIPTMTQILLALPKSSQSQQDRILTILKEGE